MAAPAPSRPFELLEERVMFHKYFDWTMVECECESLVSYGCGPLGQHIVECLTHLAGLRGGDDHLPRLAVHVLDEVLPRFEEEVPGELARIYGSDDADWKVKAYGTKVGIFGEIEAVDDEGGAPLSVTQSQEKVRERKSENLRRASWSSA